MDITITVNGETATIPIADDIAESLIAELKREKLPMRETAEGDVQPFRYPRPILDWSISELNTCLGYKIKGLQVKPQTILDAEAEVEAANAKLEALTRPAGPPLSEMRFSLKSNQ